MIPTTLVELIRRRAEQDPDRRLYTFLVDGESEEIHLTYGELDRQARSIAVLLQSLGTSGDHVLLLFPPGLEFMAAAAGCLYAGMLPVYTYPPDPSRLLQTLPGFLMIAKDSEAKIILTSSLIQAMSDPLFEIAPELKMFRWVTIDQAEVDPASDWKEPRLSRGDPAGILYTSGGTGDPKGVMISHENILQQLFQAAETTAQSSDTHIVSWLPFYHVSGIGIALQPIVTGSSLILLSPLSFLERPFRWLQAISRYGAAVSLGPNFAYDLCVEQVTPEEQKTLDLSGWEVAGCGAEPIRAETLDRFTNAFSPCGFRREAFMTGYGLSEATLMVSSGRNGEAPVVKTLDRLALQKNRVMETDSESLDRQTLVGCGNPLPNQTLKIVNPETLSACSPDEIGEIWVKGPSVTLGYWRRPQETESTFRAFTSDQQEGPFLRTGDLGFLEKGELFVTGRLKELIIIRGRNHYPQDIEQTVQRSHPALRKECGAAFSIEVDDEEQLVVVQEVKSSENLEVNAVIKSIRVAVSKNHGIHVQALALVQPDSIPKTRNLKIQRNVCRTRFLEGGLEIVASSTLGDPHSGDYLAPRNPPEELLAEIFSEVLELKQIGVNDSFFELGGNSLLATQLISRVRELFKVEISLESFFESPTIAGLTETLVKSEPAPGQISAIARLRKHIEQMSPDEIRTTLQRKRRHSF